MSPVDPPAGEDMTLSVDTPAFTIQPGEEKVFCYYTTLSNAAAAGVHHIESSMTPGSHHMIVLRQDEAKRPDGTLEECSGFGLDGGIPVWLYASQKPADELVFPDGVAMPLDAGQHVMINMHYLNSSDQAIEASVHVAFDAYAAGTDYTPAHAFVTFDTGIHVAAGATGTGGGTCDVPPGVNFLTMTTHSHRYTTSASVRDGDATGAMVMQSTDWEHATVQQWQAPYFQFASNKLTYQCDYTNTTDHELTTGESAVSSEMCMAIGVFFPSTSDMFCLDSATLPI